MHECILRPGVWEVFNKTDKDVLVTVYVPEEFGWPIAPGLSMRLEVRFDTIMAVENPRDIRLIQVR